MNADDIFLYLLGAIVVAGYNVKQLLVAVYIVSSLVVFWRELDTRAEKWEYEINDSPYGPPGTLHVSLWDVIISVLWSLVPVFNTLYVVVLLWTVTFDRARTVSRVPIKEEHT